jgi:hypothetical protein
LVETEVVAETRPPAAQLGEERVDVHHDVSPDLRYASSTACPASGAVVGKRRIVALASVVTWALDD